MALASVLGAASVALTGCLGDDDKNDAAPPPPPPAPSSPAPSAPANESDGAAGQPPAGNATVTPPGTKLRIGQRAVVPYESGSRRGTLALTVTAVRPGDKAAFASKFGSKAQGMTPYYVLYTVENVGGGPDLANISAPLLTAVAAGGGSTGAIVVGTMPGCDRGRPGPDFGTAGAKFQTCRLQAARQGVQAVGAKYNESEGGYGSSPIIWSR